MNAPYFEAVASARFQMQHYSAASNVSIVPGGVPSLLSHRRAGLGAGERAGGRVLFRVRPPAATSRLHGEVPIPLAVVKLEEGPLVISAIVNCTPEAITIGMPVRVVMRRITPEIGLPYFEPVAEA